MPETHPPPPRPVMLADLNFEPAESDGEDRPPTPRTNPAAAIAVPVAPAPAVAADSSTRSGNEEGGLAKNVTATKDSDTVECEDADQHCQGVSAPREEKVSNLKAALVHVARKMPKNAHAHFMLGLMYQRLGQAQKAIASYEKSTEILLQDEEEVRRPDLLSSVRIHHAQCILQASMGDSFDEELETSEVDEILVKLKSSVESDHRQAAVWNILGLVLLRGGQIQSAISVLSSLTAVAPDYLDSLANLGVAYIQRDLELSAKCFQELLLKDQNHPAALVNYAALLLCKYGSLSAGAGGNVSVGPYLHQKEALAVAKECLLAAVKADPKAASVWVNLANAYYMAGEHRNSKRCLEQAAKLEPNHMPARYAIAVHRIRDAVRSQCSDDQLLWAATEMATVLKEGDPSAVDAPIAWAGLAMAHRAQHEIAAAYDTEHINLNDAEERALYTLKQAIQEDPDDAVQWHQLGLYNICMTRFSRSVNFLKAALARSPDCSYAWSNLGIALQLSDDPSSETVYKRAMVLSSTQQLHAIFSNLGILYRQHRNYEFARKMLLRSLELCPGYAPANNNLGLVFVAEGRWEDARSCFEKALQSDPLLDAAKSNLLKVLAMSKKQ
ncbi:probable UDP-N-acetylglucosamine--peptide N-acetylglucosaminyltransferase SPINDLY isoform X2 [Panicum virgatum]|uniref:probable UDP-N-acetylglucosamine--peptide N-acetylglucosaminyltransferase SPINDLY isoform X2 n=1 Tax=Panicum virgatum TaxID=38727 RepID=UPI0019D66936|nr:probable UDP-N-acetylglucosamine--peptide N-acetylglucosaminyltransferase SPINDLY isoform X2 [Panicum virgatum]